MADCFQLGKLNHIYKHGLTNNTYCKKCGRKLSSYLAKICIKCYRKLQKIPSNNPRFGKPVPFFRVKYKKQGFRSSWEANFAKWCDLSGIKWEYESKTFDLGKTTYTPDFYLPEFDCWIEIKGWWHPKAKRKFKKFKRLHQNICLFEENNLKQMSIL